MTTLLVVLSVFGYLIFGNLLGRLIFDLVSDDTPNEQLPFHKQLWRILFFPMLGLGNKKLWVDSRLGELQDSPALLGRFIKERGRDLIVLEDSSKEKFSAIYTFLWPILRLFPSTIGIVVIICMCIIGIGNCIAAMMSRVIDKAISLFIAKSKKIISQSDIEESITELKAKRDKIKSSWGEAVSLKEELELEKTKWQSYVEQEQKTGTNVERFACLIGKLTEKIAAQNERVENMKKALDWTNEKLRELENNVELIHKYEKTIAVLAKANDNVTLRKELSDVFEAALNNIKLLQNLNAGETKCLVKLDVPIEAIAHQIVDGERKENRVLQTVLKQ